jgi:hypothetical protein
MYAVHRIRAGLSSSSFCILTPAPLVHTDALNRAAALLACSPCWHHRATLLPASRCPSLPGSQGKRPAAVKSVKQAVALLNGCNGRPRQMAEVGPMPMPMLLGARPGMCLLKCKVYFARLLASIGSQHWQPGQICQVRLGQIWVHSLASRCFAAAAAG